MKKYKIELTGELVNKINYISLTQGTPRRVIVQQALSYFLALYYPEWKKNGYKNFKKKNIHGNSFSLSHRLTNRL